jgi:uncharacterized protein YndB with AHSA1/START domain
MSISPIEETVMVAAEPDQAFDLFVTQFDAWWPPEYTYSGSAERLTSISLGREPGALCTELGPHGFRVDWGRTLAIEPGRKILFLWQIAADRTPQPDPEQSSEVEVLFEAAADFATCIRLVHRAFDRCGDGAAAYRDQMASEQGWPFILAGFADFAKA